jgi:hypothetical protein
MNCEIILNNGSKFYPSFDPDHKAEVLTFYANQYASKQIKGYIIKDNSGSVLAVGI